MKYYVVNAFTNTLFGGNPAGVCLADKTLDDKTMQNIAAQNNLAETAFLHKEKEFYSLRWFTPEVEIDLCGHATLASAFVIMNYADKTADTVKFMTRSGKLTVKKEGELLVMDFPSRAPSPCEKPALLEKALGVKVLETHMSRDLLALVENEKEVQNLKPDFGLLSGIEAFAVIVTAKGEKSDFISRFFAPRAGIPEDPVTGSAHCTLIPFWSKRLDKTEMTARQLSKRGGELYCRDLGERVEIAGRAVLYLEGEIFTE